MPRHVLSPNNCPFTQGIWDLSNACFLGPTHMASGLVQPFLHSSHQRCQAWVLHNSHQSVIGHALPPSKLSLPMGSVPPSKMWFLGSTRLSISIGSAVFAQLTARSPYTSQWAPLSPQIAPSHGDLDPHLIHHSLGPSKLTTQTASESVQPFLHSSPQSALIHCVSKKFPPFNCL